MVNKKMPRLAPSLLSADFSCLGDALRFIETRGGSFVHFDVMDGSFVPEISYGQPVIRSLKSATSLPFDVHLMVEHPETQIESFAKAGADYITFHAENTVHHRRIVQMIHGLGKKAGIALVPSTPVAAINEVIPYIDLILVMSVNPGFGGQQFIQLCIEKIKKLADIQQKKGNNFLISVDGGINEKNISLVIGAGADIIVSGSAFFSGALKWEQVT
ncbi:MAG: ribulose-phosphate 3-epimerase [Treponema sp.]|jgi:ribulose-phosphate 3-epimerase|nr:ribulose-phosphate 3-epimerase [Treponema sp.]